jgi:Autographiviridae endonuclease VII
MSFARWEAGCRRHLDGAGTVTTKAQRRERYAQDPDYRAKQRAHCRAYYRAHKQEINERNRAYYHAHKQDIKPLLRRGQLKRLYGISPADYDALLEKQDGVCAICGKPSEETLCVDHCHATGTIRGLLCRKCNIALGCNEDDPATIITSLAYLGSGCRDRAGAAAQRALAARAALRDGRAGVTVRVEARSLDRLDADPAPAGDSAMRPMRNALDAQLWREGDDGEGGKARILQLIARNSRPRRSPAMSRSSGKSSTAWMLHRSRPRLRTSRREGDAPMEHRGNGNGEAGRSVPGRQLMSRPLARTQRPPFGRTKHWTVPASTKR